MVRDKDGSIRNRGPGNRLDVSCTSLSIDRGDRGPFFDSDRSSLLGSGASSRHRLHVCRVPLSRGKRSI